MLGKSTWAVIAMTCFVEIFTQAHYLHSIRDDGQLSPLFKDVSTITGSRKCSTRRWTSWNGNVCTTR